MCSVSLNSEEDVDVRVVRLCEAELAALCSCLAEDESVCAECHAE